MFKKVLHFIKYNNFTVLILVFIFIGGSGVFAATPAGQEIIGEKQVRIAGIDNTLLLEAELGELDMDFKIERVENDDKYYYVTYTYLDIVKANEAWQYQLQEKVRKVSKNLKKDLGVYLAEELSEQYEARIKDLKQEKEEAVETGETMREEVTEFSGLVGQTLAIAGRVFPGYEPVKTRVIPSPSVPPTILLSRESSVSSEIQAGEAVADSLSSVYDDYAAENDPDGDEVFGILDNCPNTANPEQIDTDEDGIGDECDARPFIKDLQDPDTAAGPGQADGQGPGTTSEGIIIENSTSTEAVGAGSGGAVGTAGEPAPTGASESASGTVEVIEIPVKAPEAPTEPPPVETVN